MSLDPEYTFSEKDLADVQSGVRSMKSLQTLLAKSENWVANIVLRDSNADIVAIVHWIDGDPMVEMISADQRDRFTKLADLIDQEIVK